MSLYNTALNCLTKKRFLPSLSHVIASRSLQQFSLNFQLQENIINNEQVERVKFITEKGPVEIKAGHDAIAQRLLGGLVEVEQNKEIKKYIISGGFAMVNPDKSMNITAAEAYPLDYIDYEATKQNIVIAEKEIPGSSDEDKVRIKIAIEMYKSILNAFENK
ncbi:hypothetical protein LY90DRAFT_708802 [Neocallimastix californiae]|uniref:ATP synthase subunit delta, mitochondrial n=1 Tax=Neocallimastix californiae TaxID=1754190 RepID=A0A1Y1ZMB8_9FUNG|nr:hypothetical protein LY90DRAFT_708802 [Neocallimastix californiae]|eukprot:ORY11370.1 hypothetical protein LY90DRAFT_708802 [Neocallimastix californiae]